MAKTKSPFFGFGSQGSVGESITTQKRGRDTIARRLPVPTDPYTLPQAYQRWLYQDYAYLWTTLSDADKAAYAATGSRHHRTGFQQWMSYALSNLPYILAFYKLDLTSAPIIYDASSYLHNGIRIGTSVTQGRIDSGLYWDGVNDNGLVADIEHLRITGDGTWEFFLARHNDVRGSVWQKNGQYEFRIEINFDAAGRLAFRCGQGAPNYTTVYFTLANVTDELLHYAITRETSSKELKLYRNGVHVQTLNYLFDVTESFTGCNIGNDSASTNPANITLDNMLLWDIILPDEIIRRHSERRYPS